MRALLAALPCVLAATAAWSVEPEPPQPQRGGRFHEPPARIDPLFVPEGPNRPSPELAGSSAGDQAAGGRLSLRLIVEMPLKRGQSRSGSGSQGAGGSSPTVQAEFRAQPLADPAWFVQARVVRHLQPALQQPWDPDFIYSFGYESARPDTFSLVYANFAGTRLRPDRARGERRWLFDQGQWSAGYQFSLPEPLQPVFLVGNGDGAQCNARLHWMQRYVQAATGKLAPGKASASLGCRYTRPDGWFAHFTAWTYAGGTQQPWDPDFTYGLGVNVPALAGLTLEYQNYSGNRWPGRPRSRGEGRFRSGSLLMSWQSPW